MLMASGGKPRRRRAVSVNSRGSSQSLHNIQSTGWISTLCSNTSIYSQTAKVSKEVNRKCRARNVTVQCRQAVVEAKTNFVPNRVLGASPPDISPLERLLPRSVRTTLAQLHSGHCRLLNSYKTRRHIRRLSGVWSGTTLRRASVQLSKPSDVTYSVGPVGQPGCSRRLPQLGQLTIGEELLGYHNNNNCTMPYSNPKCHCAQTDRQTDSV